MVGVGGGNSNCIKLLYCVILDFLHYFATGVYLVLPLLFSFFFYFWSFIIFLLASQNVDGLTSNLLLYLTFALFCLFLLYYDYYYLSKEIFPKLKLQGKDQQFFIVFFFQETLIWKHIVNFILLIFMTLRTVFICYLAFIVQSA